jgi:hypothetical protein
MEITAGPGYDINLTPEITAVVVNNAQGLTLARKDNNTKLVANN